MQGSVVMMMPWERVGTDNLFRRPSLRMGRWNSTHCGLAVGLLLVWEERPAYMLLLTLAPRPYQPYPSSRWFIKDPASGQIFLPLGSGFHRVGQFAAGSH